MYLNTVEVQNIPQCIYATVYHTANQMFFQTSFSIVLLLLGEFCKFPNVPAKICTSYHFTKNILLTTRAYACPKPYCCDIINTVKIQIVYVKFAVFIKESKNNDDEKKDVRLARQASGGNFTGYHQRHADIGRLHKKISN